MKKIVLIAIVFLTTANVKAQLVTAFPTEKEKYMKALEEYMNAQKLDKCIEVFNEFQTIVKKNQIEPNEFAKVVEVSNFMLSRTMSSFPYFYNYIASVNAYVKAKGDPGKFNEWNDVAVSSVSSKKKGDNKDFLKFVEFTQAYFEDGSLNSTNSKKWKVDTRSFSLSNVNGVLKVSFPSTRLVCYSHLDSMEILNTSGDYYPLENEWQGKNALLYWTKANIARERVYATFKKDYTLKFNSFMFSIDSVEFIHKDFFKAPLLGKYSDKLGQGDSASSTYPRFDSKELTINIKEVVPYVEFTGGFNFHGNKIIGYGTADQKASINIYQKDKVTKIATAFFTEMPIKKDGDLSALRAQVLLFVNKDTIFHPELSLIYKAAKRELRLIRGEAAMSKSKFVDTYHNCEFDIDALIWDLDSSKILLKTLVGVGVTGPNVESNNYFDRERVRMIQGTASYEPLAVIKNATEKSQSRVLDAAELAKALGKNLSENQAKTLYYQLAQEGFIVYDEATSTVLVRDKVFHYVLSNGKKKDYDIIHMKSVSKDGQDYIDLAKNTMELNGVSQVPISDTASVTFYPKNGYMQIAKNRNMKFNGMIYGGRLDFFGNNYNFKYDSFLVHLNIVDSLRINIPNGDKLDKYGNPELVTLKTNIEGVNGRLDVDLPINKSGRARLLQYPKLISKDKSYATYEYPNIYGKAYKKKDFYFELEPFKMDSLNNFTPSVINWKGKLVSAGIFPDYPEYLKIQPDLSLGFVSNTPNYLDTYKGNGKYKGELTLNMKGLTAKGNMQHHTASMNSSDMTFLPDSMKAITDTFTIAKVFDGVKTPSVASSGNDVVWKPKSDSMVIKMINQPFTMYDNMTSFKGDLVLTSKGLKGSGTFDWAEARLSSKDITFKTEEMFADTASLNIKSQFGDKVTFQTPNVKAYVNFKDRIGDFKSNIPNNPTDFAYNQYKTNIREFKWDMDKKFLDFRVPEGVADEYFESARPDQLGLKFPARRATYDLQTAILKIEKIPFIQIADALVIPDSNRVLIRAEAKMDPLKNATIWVDTTSRKHQIEKCNLEIISKAELRGNGIYKYSCAEHANQIITLSDISCKKEVTGMKKKEKTDYSLVASGDIDVNNNFYLYPNMKYFGQANLFGRNTDVYFKGFSKILFKNPAITTSEFAMVDDINPDKFLIHYDSIVKASDDGALGVGLFIDKSSETPAPYTSFFAPLKNSDDKALIRPIGAVAYNNKTGEYSFGTEQRVKGELGIGPIMKLDDAKGNVTAEGPISFAVDFGALKMDAVGTFKQDMAQKEFAFNLTFGLDARTFAKTVEEKLETYMFNDNMDLSEINYETAKFRTVLKHLVDEKDDAKMLKEYELTGAFKRTKSLFHYLVFTDVNFVYDPDEFTFRSYGKIGLSFVGERAIHHKLDGYIEFAPRSTGDYFNIYLKTASGEWFFFEYKPGILGMVSSYDDFGRTIAAVSPDKRRVEGDKGKFYSYSIGSSLNKEEFVDRMKEKKNPVLLEDKNALKKKVPVDSAALKAKLPSVAPKQGEDKSIEPKKDNPTKETPGGEQSKPVAPKTEEAPKSQTPDTNSDDSGTLGKTKKDKKAKSNDGPPE